MRDIEFESRGPVRAPGTIAPRLLAGLPRFRYGFWLDHADCDCFLRLLSRHQPVTFSQFFALARRRFAAPWSFPMIGLVRAVALCAALALGLCLDLGPGLGLVSAQAAEKAFKRDDLADSAIKLQAQIKGE